MAYKKFSNIFSSLNIFLFNSKLQLTNLPLKPEINRQSRIIAVFFWHIAIRLFQLQWRAQVVLQQLQLGIYVDAVFGPLEADFGVAVREALDVNWADLDVHGVELELHLTGDDRMQSCGIADGFVFVKRH